MQFLNIVIQKVSSCSLSVNPLCPKNKATLDMILVSIDLPFLHIYHNSTIYSLLCLEFLTTVMCWASYLFHHISVVCFFSLVVFHCIGLPYFVYSFTGWTFWFSSWPLWTMLLRTFAKWLFCGHYVFISDKFLVGKFPSHIWSLTFFKTPLS